MKKRIITGLVMAVILLPMIFVPQLKRVFELFLILLTILASVEMLNMYDHHKKNPIGVKILCVISTILLYFAIVGSFPVCEDSLINNFLSSFTMPNMSPFKFNLFLTIGLIFLSVFSCMVFVDGFDASDVGRCLTVIIYIGVTFASVTVLRSYGARFIVFLLFITTSTDIFALVFGLSFGKHKMAPKISPKKTWEGAIGGTCVAVIIGFLFLYFYKDFAGAFHEEGGIIFFKGVFNQEIFTNHGIVIFCLMLSGFMSICSQIGDLVASKLKRTYDIKDFSNLFPGHGGVLDRFDSTLFTATVFLLFLQFEAIIFPIV